MPDSPDRGNMTPDNRHSDDWLGQFEKKDSDAAASRPSWDNKPFSDVLAAYRTETDPDIRQEQKNRLQDLFAKAEQAGAAELVRRSANRAIERAIYPIDAITDLREAEQPAVSDPGLEGIVDEMNRIIELRILQADLENQIIIARSKGEDAADIEFDKANVDSVLGQVDYWDPKLEASRLGRHANMLEIQRRIEQDPNDYLLNLRNGKIAASVRQNFIEPSVIQNELHVVIRSSSPESLVSNIRRLALEVEQRAAENPQYGRQGYAHTAQLLVENTAKQIELSIQRASGFVDQDDIDKQIRLLDTGVDLLDRGAVLADLGKDHTSAVSAPANNDATELLIRALGGELGYERELAQRGTDFEKQEFLRDILRGFEGGPYHSTSPASASVIRKLELTLRYSEDLDSSIRREIETRLRLQESFALIREAGGNIETREPGQLTIGLAATTAKSRTKDIRGAEVLHLLGEGLPQMDIAHAWDLLQEANYFPAANEEKRGYRGLVAEANDMELRRIAAARVVQNRDDININHILRMVKSGDNIVPPLTPEEAENIFPIEGTEYADADPTLGKVITNYQTDTNQHRKEAVKNLMLRKIENRIREKLQADIASNSSPNTDETGRRKADEARLVLSSPDRLRNNASDSLKLAQNLAEATMETSVFNRFALQGNDHPGEHFGLRTYRFKRDKAQRDHGPDFHLDWIDAIGTSYLRNASRKRTEENAPSMVYHNENGERNADLDTVLTAAEIVNSPDAVARADWQFYCTVVLGRYKQARDLILDMSVDPPGTPRGIFDAAYLNQQVKALDDADPSGALRAFFVGGRVSRGLHHEVNDVRWTTWDMNRLETIAVDTPLSSSGGSGFLTEKQWRWIVQETKVPAMTMIHRAGARAVRSTFHK